MKIQCEECCYYDRRSGLCGFCMKQILKEEETRDGDGQDDDQGAE